MNKNIENKNNTNKKSIKTLLKRGLIYLLISLIVGLSFYNWNAKSLNRDNFPMPFGVGISVVMSGSMEPELSVDDIIFVKASSEYRVGDNVVFIDGNMSVVHKIISIDGDKAVTKGIANNTDDGSIKLEDIKGKVIFVIPYFGGFVRFIKSPFVIFAILLFAVLFVVKSYGDDRKNYENEKQKIKDEIEKLKNAADFSKSGNDPKK